MCRLLDLEISILGSIRPDSSTSSFFFEISVTTATIISIFSVTVFAVSDDNYDSL